VTEAGDDFLNVLALDRFALAEIIVFVKERTEIELEAPRRRFDADAWSHVQSRKEEAIG
jgi:hypothetical protein